MIALETVPMSRRYLEEVVALLQEVSVFEPAPETFEDIWARFSSQLNYFSIVILSAGRVVGFGALLVEHKIRGGKMGHIEDVVSSPEVRGLGVGRLLISELVKLSLIHISEPTRPY